jgi:glycosyltransferase involved in cell wall biosynthesis
MALRVAINGWFWDQPYTGSGQYLRYLLPAMRRFAPDIEFILILPSNTANTEIPGGVDVIHARGGRGNLAKVWFEQRAFPSLAGKAHVDLAHVPYWGAPLRSPVPVVVSILDVIPLALPEYASGFLPRLYTSLQSAAARGAAHILTISHAAKADILRYLDIPESSVAVTHLAVSDAYHPKLGAERDMEVKQKYDLPERFVLYFGGFDVRKQVSQLIAAYTFVAPPMGEEVPLVLAGKPPATWGTPLFPDIPQEVSESGLSGAVRFTVEVDEADKPSFYRLADLFVTPTSYEGFGLPVLEAMASGTPVIANQIPVMEEIVGEGAYLVEAGSSRAMAGAILALLVDDNLRETQATRGLAQATKFNWRKTAKETIAVYEQVVGADKHK